MPADPDDFGAADGALPIALPVPDKRRGVAVAAIDRALAEWALRLYPVASDPRDAETNRLATHETIAASLPALAGGIIGHLEAEGVF